MLRSLMIPGKLLCFRFNVDPEITGSLDEKLKNPRQSCSQIVAKRL
jgi:hypothetical protein